MSSRCASPLAPLRECNKLRACFVVGYATSNEEKAVHTGLVGQGAGVLILQQWPFDVPRACGLSRVACAKKRSAHWAMTSRLDTQYTLLTEFEGSGLLRYCYCPQDIA